MEKLLHVPAEVHGPCVDLLHMPSHPACRSVRYGLIIRSDPKIHIAFDWQLMIAKEDIRRRIIELEVEHRDLDSVIDLLASDVLRDELQLRRLKKRKLQLKDHITLLKMQLIPDIPA